MFSWWATFSARAKWRSVMSAGSSVAKKYLTGSGVVREAIYRQESFIRTVIFFLHVRIFIATLLVLLLSRVADAQKTVSFPTQDGGIVFADLYGAGERGIVL